VLIAVRALGGDTATQRGVVLLLLVVLVSYLLMRLWNRASESTS